VARSEAGLPYPWGTSFDTAKCNSRESGIGETTPVNAYEAGQSGAGCYDMAGNVWEFVQAADIGKSGCVLRGGSFANERNEVHSYLRLFGVPRRHRPHDFGFRLSLLTDPGKAGEKANMHSALRNLE
jgi:formylglycine-generating enzyme required for sulfatase activity